MGNIDYFILIFKLAVQRQLRLVGIFFLFIVASLLDFIGIGLIAIYATILLTPEIIFNNEIIRSYPSIYSILETINLPIYLGLFLLSIFFFKSTLGIFIHSRILSFSHIQQKNLRFLLLKKYQNISFIDYTKSKTSDHITTIGVCVRAYGTVLHGALIFCADIIVALGIFALLIYSSGIVIIVVVFFLLAILYAYKKIFINKLNYHGEVVNEGYIYVHQTIQEFFEGFKELKIHRKYGYFEEKIKAGTEKVAKSDTIQSLFSVIPRLLLEFLLVFFIVVVVITSLLFGHNITEIVPVVALFGAAALRLAPMLNQTTNFLGKFEFAKNSIDRINNALSMSNIELKNLTNNDDIEKIEFNNLKFRSVSFKYPSTQESVLSDISFEIKKGETIGIFGPSGSGKTTFVDIFTGLLMPHKGSILFNNQEINNLNNVWQNKIAYLPQDAFLINDKLSMNIALGLVEEEIDQNMILKSIDNAKLTEFTNNLPKGVNTLIGERGVNISGGQKQRIALARAFYFKRDILIFDESTSSLDEQIEKEIVEEIKLLKGTKTIIMISHNPNTLKYCDRIYNIKDGVLRQD